MPLPENLPLGYLPFEPPLESAPDLHEFWELWRGERFWACHEALETVWQEETGPRRAFLNGLIHGAVAVFQFRRGNWNGAARQMVRARVKLSAHLPSCDGVDLEAFLSGLAGEIAPGYQHLTPQQHTDLRALEARLRVSYR